MNPSSRKSPLPIIATHLLAMALGYAAWSNFSKPSAPDPGTAASATSATTAGRTKANRDRAGDRTRQLTAEQQRGDALLEKIAGSTPAEHGDEEPDSIRERQIMELVEAAGRTPVAAEPAARVRQLKTDELDSRLMSPEYAVAALQWLRSDPDAAMKFLCSWGISAVLGADIQNGIPAGIPIDALADELGWSKLIKYLGDDENINPDSLLKTLARGFSKSPDMGQIPALKQASGDRWQDMMNALAVAWPPNRADDLFTLAMQENNVSLLHQYVGDNNPGRAEWLVGKMAGMTEEMKRELMKADGAYTLLYGNLHADFALRVEGMWLAADESVTKDLPPDHFRNQAIVQDVAQALNEAGRDLRYAFRNGELTADEVLEEVKKILPQQAAASPDGVWRQVFQELAEENPRAAMKMLDGLPENERHLAVLKAGTEIFNEVNPQVFYDFLQNAPAADEGELWAARVAAWTAHTDGLHERLGDAYVRWVENLPAGLDRELAAYHLLSGDDERNLPAADEARLSSYVTDPRLRLRRIEYGDPDEAPSE